MYSNTNFTSRDTNKNTLAQCNMKIPSSIYWHSSSEAAKVSTILTITLNVLTMPMTLFLNALIIFVVWKNPSLQVERVIVLAYLALTDFLIGLTCQLLFIAKEILQFETNKVHCGLGIAFFLAMGLLKGVEFYQLLGILYERYVAIIHPFQYSTRITVKRLTYATIGLWTVNTMIFLLSFITYILDMCLYIGIVGTILKFVIFVCMVYWYAKIFAAIRRQKRQIDQQQQNTNMNNPHTQRSHKGAITAALLLGCFLLSFSPIFFVIQLSQRSEVIFKDSSVWRTLQQWIETIICFSALLNPIIYGLRTRRLKEKCWEVLGFQHDIDEVVSHNACVATIPC
ncbi:melanocyte-stimulating hormone receptor-like [Actinia tenebrosa]|uniref:Melanocyte-stimulating hormone receptor-like n=1 Tax=Actinia tenebrosa TaxID=6105 RepID=A0A6P8JFA0_ACTTE|nr:melanocyte-stimulating hormone receptor-like [Actinia tenebrosa]